MRIGAKLPNSGPLALDPGIPELARTLEEAGFDSLWVADHVVLPRVMASRYPFAMDGKATWATDTPYFDSLVALALATAVTERVGLGTGVLVLPQRQPLVTAKQVASIDVASGGRLTLGVGAGWLEEEFDALNVPFDTRGSRLEEWIALLRACWTGTPAAFEGRHYTLPPDILCFPPPAHAVPLLVGGHTKPAVRRATTIGDGWIGQQSLGALDPAEIRAVRDAGARQVVLRIVEAAGRDAELAPHLPELAGAGVDEVIVDVDWTAGDPTRQLEALKSSVA
jgi:probable F420-dependent oxidoreductase